MVVASGIFLFRLLCLLVSCDPVHKPPEIRLTPERSSDIKRNIKVSSTDPIVNTNAGVVQGYYGKSTSGREFFAFEGIPYGESTAGEGRWKSPQPRRPWQGVRQTKKPGPACLQIDPFRLLQVHGSEDCLYANVYTPQLPIIDEGSDFTRNLPVIVFIHGGGFMFGSGSDYGPAYMLNEDVVLVTFNYRLGILGFLSTGDEEIPGNFGLKDQALALRWVNENIKYFGGNPNNVTLLGNSAGGVSAHLHLISNRTREYFSSSYSSSGTAFEYWAVQNQEHINRLTNRLAVNFRCRRGDIKTTVRCLKGVNTNFLVGATVHLYDWTPFPIIMFSPVVEPDHPDAFLTKWPTEAYKTGSVSNKPFIAGYNENEGSMPMLFLLPLMRTFPLRVMWDKIAPYYFEYKYVAENPDLITSEVTEFYFNGTSPRRASLDVFARAFSDRFINMGVIKAVQAHSESGAPSYFYRFAFKEGNHNLGNFVGYSSKEWGAAGHIEDMFYFFNVSLLVDAHSQSDPENELSKIMIKLLVNYAKTGEPSYEDSETGTIYHIWKPVADAQVIKGLQFDRKVEMIDLPREEVSRLNFWSNRHIPNVTLWAPLL